MTGAAPCPYRIYRVSGRPIFAAPLSPRGLRRAGLGRYQPVTPRRAAFRSLVNLSMLARADWLLGTTADDPVGSAGFSFRAWMDDVRGALGASGAEGVVIWPPQRERGRIYVHLFDGGLRPIGFAKVAFDAHNAECLRREAATLRELERQAPRTFRAPRVLAEGAQGSAWHVVLEALPESARPLDASAAFPARCAAEFAGPPRRVPSERLRELSWWSAHERAAAGGAFDAELRGLLAGGAAVCRAHGDFGPANIVRDGATLWIFDWEESRPDGPVLADEVMYTFGMDLQASREPRRALALLRERFLRAGGSPRAEVMLALAFRRALGMADAARIIECWEGE
jgi:hypothetical protein